MQLTEQYTVLNLNYIFFFIFKSISFPFCLQDSVNPFPFRSASKFWLCYLCSSSKNQQRISPLLSLMHSLGCKEKETATQMHFKHSAWDLLKLNFNRSHKYRITALCIDTTFSEKNLETAFFQQKGKLCIRCSATLTFVVDASVVADFQKL